jgi:hypothetical protein
MGRSQAQLIIASGQGPISAQASTPRPQLSNFPYGLAPTIFQVKSRFRADASGRIIASARWRLPSPSPLASILAEMAPSSRGHLRFDAPPAGALTPRCLIAPSVSPSPRSRSLACLACSLFCASSLHRTGRLSETLTKQRRPAAVPSTTSRNVRSDGRFRGQKRTRYAHYELSRS